jgi:hypothetical protein
VISSVSKLVGRFGLHKGTLRSALTAFGAALVLSCLPASAQAYYSCGTVRWNYDVGDNYSYYATFQSLGFHSGITVQGMRCSDARSFVRRYARALSSTRRLGPTTSPPAI